MIRNSPSKINKKGNRTAWNAHIKSCIQLEKCSPIIDGSNLEKETLVKLENHLICFDYLVINSQNLLIMKWEIDNLDQVCFKLNVHFKNLI